MRPTLFILFLASTAAGCVDDRGPASKGLQSIKVTLDNPTADQLGLPNAPVSFNQMTVDLEAIGPDGKRLASDYDASVYLSFGGNKVGAATNCGATTDISPLAMVHLTGGFAGGQTISLVQAFGLASLWLEEPTSHALGASPPIYFANPTISDVQTPVDLTDPTASYCSPWDGRHMIVDHATGNGQLVVTAITLSSYVVADTGAMYDPVANTGGFNHLYVFTFGQPSDDIRPGTVLNNLSGNISKFNGFSELNFPLQDVSAQIAQVPAPAEVTAADRTNKDISKLLRLAAATVKVTGAVCAVGSDADSQDEWVKYDTFYLDPAGGANCGTSTMSFNTYGIILPGKVVGSFDPLASVGKSVTISGMLKNTSGQNPACKGYTGAPDVDCKIDADCAAAAADPRYGAYVNPADGTTCAQALAKSSVHCVQGSCRRGVYNFWSIVVPDQYSITQ